MKTASIPSITDLSHRVGAVLREEPTERGRMAAMALTTDIMRRHDVTRDDLMQGTLRSRVGKVQAHYGWQDKIEEV